MWNLLLYNWRLQNPFSTEHSSFYSTNVACGGLLTCLHVGWGLSRWKSCMGVWWVCKRDGSNAWGKQNNQQARRRCGLACVTAGIKCPHAGKENEGSHWSTWKWAMHEKSAAGSVGEGEVKGRSYSSWKENKMKQTAGVGHAGRKKRANLEKEEAGQAWGHARAREGRGPVGLGRGPTREKKAREGAILARQAGAEAGMGGKRATGEGKSRSGLRCA